MVTAGSSAQRTQTITYSHQMQYATVPQDHWKLGLGGGAGTCQFDRLTARPLAADLGGLACTDARGRTRRNTGYGFVSYAHVRVAAEIGSVLAAGRHLTVPGHGHLAIVWASRLPGVTLVGHDRQHLATLKL
ncbi:MAG TPA: hypothetical protein VMV17_16845 [Streptosporangiaceae bacterium]|nr:hypothetical protein [Streptosporangiaceae bacterium]